jgi:hypothetical protein
LGEREWKMGTLPFLNPKLLFLIKAFANETRSKSWDFQMEEGELGLAIKRFNTR